MDLEILKIVAERACRKVSPKILQALKGDINLESFYKGEKDIVTQLDIWSEEQIKNEILQNFPAHLIIGEESAKELERKTGKTLADLSNQSICWVIDPIDGTANFYNHIPCCAISIGVLVQGKKTVGVIYDPSRDEMFSAIRGQGATLNGNPISVSSKTKLIDSMVNVGFPIDIHKRWEVYSCLLEKVLSSCGRIRNFGSSAIELSWVACGRTDAFLEYSLKPWDMAAGALIVEEAGGKVVDFASFSANSEFSIFSDSLLATNQGVHSQLLDLIRSSARS